MHPNAALVQRGFDAFATGDMATLDELIADDVVWVTESGIGAGRTEGKQALFELWARIPAETEGSFRQDVTSIIADDRVAVANVEVSASRRGVSAERTPSVLVFVIRDGKVLEGRVIASDPDLDNAMWAD